MTQQIANETLTLEERSLPSEPKVDHFDDLDQLARVLRQGEEITQTSIQRFYPGVIGLATSSMEDSEVELKATPITKCTHTTRLK